MQYFLGAVFLLASFVASSTVNNQHTNTDADSISSQEITSLKGDIQTLEITLQQSRDRQDWWNRLYLKLTVATLSVAAASGIALWVCQKQASSIEYASRPNTEALAKKNARLRDLLDQDAKTKVSKAQQDASEANSKAEGFRLDIARANDSAGRAQAQVAGASAEAAKATQKAAEATTAQQQLQIELAKQQEKAAIAEESLARLKESFKDRIILPAQKKVLIAALNKVQSGRVEVWWTASDTDAYGLATQIVESFKEAGWTDVSERFAAGVTGNGIFISVHDHLHPPAYAVAVQQAFALIGFELIGVSKPEIPEGITHIFIGHKIPSQ